MSPAANANAAVKSFLSNDPTRPVDPSGPTATLDVSPFSVANVHAAVPLALHCTWPVTPAVVSPRYSISRSSARSLGLARRIRLCRGRGHHPAFLPLYQRCEFGGLHQTRAVNLAQF